MCLQKFKRCLRAALARSRIYQCLLDKVIKDRSYSEMNIKSKITSLLYNLELSLPVGSANQMNKLSLVGMQGGSLKLTSDSFCRVLPRFTTEARHWTTITRVQSVHMTGCQPTREILPPIRGL